MDIAKQLVNQLGNKAFYMMGAYAIVLLKNGIKFRIKGSKQINSIQILLTSSDTYTIEFAKVTENEYTVIHEIEDVYADKLKEVIEQHTSLYLSL